MTLKERLKTAGSSLATYMTACAAVVRAIFGRRQPRVASTTPKVPSVVPTPPEVLKPAPRFARKYIILAVATVIVGLCAIAFFRKSPPIVALQAKAAGLFSRKKSPAPPPASKPAEAHEAKPAEAHEAKPAEAHASKPAQAATPKLAEPPPQQLPPNSLVSERMVRSCDNLAKPRLAVSSTGTDVYAVAVCKQFGLWKEPTLQRNE